MRTNHFNANFAGVQSVRQRKSCKPMVAWMLLATSVAVSGSAWAGCDTVKEGLVACYPFDGDAKDYSGNGNHGTVYGGATLTTDQLGDPNRAYLFNGKSSYIRVPHNSTLNMQGALTLSGWINSKNMTQFDQDLISKTANGAYSLILNEGQGTENGQSKFCFLVNVSGKYHYVYSQEHLDYRWYHVVGSYDGQKARIYVNGILEGEKQLQGAITNNAVPLILGNESGELNEPVNGILDDLRIYNRALTEAEIQQLAGVAKLTLTVTKTGNGTLTGNGINCGTDCTEDLAPNTAVTLTATPAADSVFKQWLGDCTGTAATTTVTLDKAKSCAATFETKPVEPPPVGTPGNLTVQKAGNGSGTIKVTSPKDTLNCDLACQTASHQYDASVTKAKLSAKPYNAGVQFTGWSGSCSGTEPIVTVTLEQAKTCTATFELIPKDQLPAGIYNFLFSTVGTGKGTVKSILGTINCGSHCEGNYVEGLKLVVTAEPSPLSTFVKWSDGCGVKDPTNPRTSILADSHKTCSAEFTSAMEIAANSLTDTLYQDPTVETQFPRALNEACVNEALWLAATPMAFVDNHLKVVGDWPTQFNGLNWYNKSPVGTCTQSVKVNSDTHGDYVEVRVNLQTVAGATESAGIIISVEDLSAQSNWGYTPVYLPWVQM